MTKPLRTIPTYDDVKCPLFRNKEWGYCCVFEAECVVLKGQARIGTTVVNGGGVREN